MSAIYRERLHAAFCVYQVMSLAFLVDSKAPKLSMYKKLLDHSTSIVSVTVLLRDVLKKSYPISGFYD